MTESILKYNGIALRNVQTLSLSEVPVHDDSGQQFLYNKVTLKVLGYITKDDHQSLGLYPRVVNYSTSSTSGEGSALQYKVLREFLLQPRRRLIYTTAFEGYQENQTAPTVGTMVLFDILPPQAETIADVDDNTGMLSSDGTSLNGVPDNGVLIHQMTAMHDLHGGPTPKMVNITNVANNTVWRVEFEVEFCQAGGCPVTDVYRTLPYGEDFSETDTVRAPGNAVLEGVHRKIGVLSNRWSCLDRYDEASYLVRTYSGVVTLANPHWNPNDYRVLTLPPLVPGMRRESIEYKASEDGLKLHYTITDKEVTITPPAGCADINIVHTEAAVQFGAMVNFHLRVDLKGEKTGSLYTLSRIAVCVVESRLNLTLADQDKNTATIVDHYEMITEHGSNQNLSLSCVVSGRRMKGNANAAQGNGIPGNHFNTISNETFSRLSRTKAGTQLDQYNNMLAKGSRGESLAAQAEPSHVPSLSALHAALRTKCEGVFGMDASLDTQTTIEYRLERRSDIDSAVNDYNISSIYGYYAPEILVEIVQKLPDSPDLLKYSRDTYENAYTHYDITSRYDTKSTSVALPVAAAKNNFTIASDSVFVDIGTKQRKRIIRIRAERIGAKPKLPPVPDTFDEEGEYFQGRNRIIRHKKLDERVLYNNPIPTADGDKLLYSAELEVEYAIDNQPIYHRFGQPEYMHIPETLTDKFRNRINTALDGQGNPISNPSPEETGVFSGSWQLWR